MKKHPPLATPSKRGEKSWHCHGEKPGKRGDFRLGTQGVFGDLLRKISGEPIEPQGSHGGYAVAGGIFFKRSPGTPGEPRGLRGSLGHLFQKISYDPTVAYGVLWAPWVSFFTKFTNRDTHPPPPCVCACCKRKEGRQDSLHLLPAFLCFPLFPFPLFQRSSKGVCHSLFFF